MRAAAAAEPGPMDTPMEDAPAVMRRGRVLVKHKPSAEKQHSTETPKLTMAEVFKLKSSTRRYKIDLVIVGAKHCQPSGKPVPQENPRFAQQSQMILLGHDSAEILITIEATSDDRAWLEEIASMLMLKKTVTLEQPILSPTK